MFALLAVHFSSAESEATRAWLLTLVWMAKQLHGVSRVRWSFLTHSAFQFFHNSFLCQAFLDKVFTLAPSLPSALIKNYAQCEWKF